MELGTKVIGKMITNKEKESKDGLMVADTKDNTKMVKRTEKVDMSGVMIANMKETG